MQQQQEPSIPLVSMNNGGNSVAEPPGNLVGLGVSSSASMSSTTPLKAAPSYGYSAISEEQIIKAYHSRYGNVGQRLARRKTLFAKRRQTGDVTCFLALLGLFFVVIDTELCVQRVYDKSSAGSKFVKSLVTLSSVALAAFVAQYHLLETRIYMVDNLYENWQLTLTRRRIARFLVEMIICLVHPFPGDNDYIIVPSVTTEEVRNVTDVKLTTEKQLIIESVRYPVDAMLSLPMFLRVYLVCRCIKLHSKIFQDIACQSLGAFNKVKIDFQFIFKAYMQQYPGYSMTVLVSSLFFWASWSLRACEMYHDERSHLDDFLDSMWLVAITFLTVGYGDVVPVSYCGRFISVLTGMSGAACTALTVAVLTRKLELSREEKYVHSFVNDVELCKKLKRYAANTIQNAWLVFKYKRNLAPDALIIKHQQKLLQAIRKMQAIHEERRILGDSTLTLQEMHTVQQMSYNALKNTQHKANEIESRVSAVERSLHSLNDKIDLLVRSMKR